MNSHRFSTVLVGADLFGAGLINGRGCTFTFHTCHAVRMVQLSERKPFTHKRLYGRGEFARSAIDTC